MKLTPLHINTEYSFQKSNIKIDTLIKRAKEIGLKQILITDKNNLFGVSEFVTKCKKDNIKPIIGLDLEVENFQLILIAKNYNGYVHLNHLSSKKMNGNNIERKDIDSSNIFIIDHPINGCFYKNNEILKFKNFFIGSKNPSKSNEIFVKEGFFLEDEDKNIIKIINEMNETKIDINSIQKISFTNENELWAKKINSLIEKCSFEMPNKLNILPKFNNDLNITSKEYLKEIVFKNFEEKSKNFENKEKYLKRIKYELKIIEEMKFEDYFLIIWDFIKWAKERNILIGPGRGSAAGSLISYILNITTVDPLKYNLYFERFLNPKRRNMPDIDIDIQDTRRNEIIDYLFKKYGKNKVGLISTFSRLGAKSSIRDVARFLKLPMKEVNAICKLIPIDLNLKESYNESANFRALINSKTVYSNMFKIAEKIEGLPRQISTHAAGIVISNNDLNNKVATLKVNENYNQIQFPMDYLESFSLLKIDLLGLKNLTIVQKIQEEIFLNKNKRIALSRIPFNDKKTNDLLSSANTNGIFQLESYGMKKTLREVGVTSLDDIVAIISLYRPGPMENISLYADIKKRKKERISISKDFDEITKSTYGIIIYQEQIMEIAQKISGMSFSQADIFRRAISKKNIDLINSLKKEFMDGGIKKGYNEKEISNIYNLIEKFAHYGFNKSHAVAYGMLAYWMAYLKARFKFEFYTSLLEFSISSQKILKKYMQEAKRENILVIPPSINSSEIKVINNTKKIILPLQIIKGLGNVMASKILKERSKKRFNDFFDFISRTYISGIGQSTIEILIKSNSLREFGNMQTLLDSLPLAIRYVNIISVKKEGRVILNETIMPKPKLIVSERNISNEIFNEKKLFGFQMNVFLTSNKENENKLLNLKPGNIKEVVFLVERIRKIKTKLNKNMAIINISDSTHSIELIVFPDVYKSIESTKDKSIVKGKIRCSLNNNEVKFILNDRWKEL